MQVPAKSTIAASERVLNVLEKSPTDEPLQLPSNIRHVAGGAEAALAQVVIRWAQRKKGAQLETFIETTEQIEDFVRRLPGLVAGLCADKAIGRGKTGSIATELRQHALARLEHLQSNKPKSAYRGSSVEIVCADHLGRSKPYLLYSPDQYQRSSLHSRGKFHALADWLLDHTIPESYRKHVPSDTAEAIGSMLFELFKNTEDHALTDIAGNFLDVSIRAIKTLHHEIAPAKLTQIVGEYAPLAKYCETLVAPQGAVHTHLFELSVLDSGPGFAATWTRSELSDLSIEQEENAVRACFESGSAKGRSRFGEGLPHVLRLMRQEKGFLRLRTGRLSFYIDFSKEEQSADSPLCRYNQADNTEFAPVSGSLLTILIPMRRT